MGKDINDTMKDGFETLSRLEALFQKGCLPIQTLIGINVETLG